MTDPSARAQTLRRILDYGDADVALVQESMVLLSARVGVLMGAVKQRLLSADAEETFFADDPDNAMAFGGQLSEFIMKSSAGNFSPEYCSFVAGFAQRLPVQPRSSLFVATVAVIGQWIAEVLSEELRADHARLKAMLGAWQKLMAINLDLLLTGIESR